VALEAIEHQRAEAQGATDWAHREERLTALRRLAAKLGEL
jgi:hypothetical protein